MLSITILSLVVHIELDIAPCGILAHTPNSHRKLGIKHRYLSLLAYWSHCKPLIYFRFPFNLTFLHDFDKKCLHFILR